jgi:4-amino-4-deoxy-L-arabinose transferase-like glycosyltransferase
LDVSVGRVIPAASRFWLAIAGLTLVGLVLRWAGIHDPIFDHPSWRQGDTAAIARNFAQLQYNPLFPQTDYDGPAPNYVELELQIVPFLAATLYKIFGVHEIFGRLISLAFGVATIPLLGAFGRWLFRSPVAGIGAAAAFTILPGAWYYSRTFMPDTAMTFFLTAALFACARWIVDDEARNWRSWTIAALLLMTAFLAKPVAVAAVIPIGAAAIARFGLRGTFVRPQVWLLAVVAFVPLAVYDAIVSSHAEWHWASGITRLHVVPSLIASLTSLHALALKIKAFALAIKMLGTTMAGPILLLVAAIGLLVKLRSRSDALVWGWLGGGLLYAYVVVTVERVDYYLYLLLPLVALLVGHVLEAAVRAAGDVAPRRTIVAAAAAVVWLGAAYTGHREIAPYYAWSHVNYVRAKQLDARLAPGALVVMGHYDPSILYTIGRKGWEEDPHAWTPFDEESAIRKGARYYISVEHRRLKQTNLELYCWLARFPVLDPSAAWPVYETDPGKVLPGAEARWQAFRRREFAGAYADWRRVWRSAPDPCR